MAKGFNPHPAVMLGATQDHLKLGQLFWCFQSSPSVLGATTNRWANPRECVSIPSVLGATALPAVPLRAVQSHSSNAGCYPRAAFFILSKIGVFSILTQR